MEKQETQISVPGNTISESAQPKNSLVKMNEVCENSTKDDNQIPPMPSGQQEALPHLDEECLDQNRNERQALSKIPHAGRTKEGLDNDRFEKRSGCIKKDWKKARRVVFRKRLGRFGSKGNRSRSLRKRIFRMILEATEKEKEAERNLGEATSQDGQPCEKATSSKTPDNNNSWSTNNEKFKHRFSRKTGKLHKLYKIQEKFNSYKREE